MKHLHLLTHCTGHPAPSYLSATLNRESLVVALITLTKADISAVYKHAILDYLTELWYAYIYFQICCTDSSSFKHEIFLEQTPSFQSLSLEFWDAISNHLLNESTYVVNSCFEALRKLCLYEAASPDVSGMFDNPETL